MIASYDHEHYDPSMIGRLDGAWGHVDSAINRRIAGLLPRGARVLDLGCGFGSLTDQLAASHRVFGIDPLVGCLRAAVRRQPGTAAICGSATQLPLRPGSANVVVLKDVLHHLVDEIPTERLFEEFEQLGVSRVVVVDPNPNPFLLAARRLLRHVDPVCGPGEAARLFEANGFRVERTEYGVLFSLPLSGGYVGPVLLPPWRGLWIPLLWAEDLICRVLDRLRLGRFVCWRYYLVASLETADRP